VSVLDFSLLICPATKQSLSLAPKALLQAINTKIRRRALKNEFGQTLRKPLEAALIRTDLTLLYPIREKLPIVLFGESVDLYQVGIRDVKTMMEKP